MDIQKYNNKKTQIEKAIYSVSARNSDIQELKVALAKAMAKAIADSGQKANDDDVDYLMRTMPAEILIQAPGIKLDEIAIAISRGVYGEYGKYYGLNAVSFMFFIKKYMESEERIKAAKELNKSIEPEVAIPSPEEVQQRVRKVIVRAYQAFLEKGFYEDYGNFIYDKMDEMGLISLSSSRKAQIYQQAQQSLASKKNPQNAGNLQEFKDFTAAMELINNPDSISGKDIIKKEAKKIALQVVFTDFSEVETDINELVNQKQNF